MTVMVPRLRGQVVWPGRRQITKCEGHSGLTASSSLFRITSSLPFHTLSFSSQIHSSISSFSSQIHSSVSSLSSLIHPSISSFSSQIHSSTRSLSSLIHSTVTIFQNYSLLLASSRAQIPSNILSTSFLIYSLGCATLSSILCSPAHWSMSTGSSFVPHSNLQPVYGSSLPLGAPTRLINNHSSLALLYTTRSLYSENWSKNANISWMCIISLRMHILGNVYKRIYDAIDSGRIMQIQMIGHGKKLSIFMKSPPFLRWKQTHRYTFNMENNACINHKQKIPSKTFTNSLALKRFHMQIQFCRWQLYHLFQWVIHKILSSA